MAHCAWRVCPQLPAVLPELLVGQTISGLDVCTNWQELAPTQRLLHRGCQCAFRASPPLPPLGRPKLPARDFESIKGVSTNVPLHGKTPGRSNAPLHSKILKWCPLWVTRGSLLLQPHDIRDAQRCPYRAWHPVERNSMRQAPQEACCIHPKTAHAFQEAETALEQSGQFWQALIKELSLAEGKAGVSQHLALHWQWHEACYDFQKLLVELPCLSEDHHLMTAMKQTRLGLMQPMHSSSCGTWHIHTW